MLQTILLSASLVSSPADLDGHWIGALVQDDGAVPVEVTIDADAAPPAGRFSLPEWAVFDVPVAVEIDGDEFAIGCSSPWGGSRGPAPTS